MFWRRRRDDLSRGSRELRCSFCDKDANQVRKLIAGPVAYICDECVALCVDIITDDARAQARPTEATGEVIEPRQHIRVGEPRWSSTLRCTLCRMPVVVEEALSLEGRGLLCLACVADVQAAAVANEESGEPPESER